jgi:hypothetical protein
MPFGMCLRVLGALEKVKPQIAQITQISSSIHLRDLRNLRFIPSLLAHFFI